MKKLLLSLALTLSMAATASADFTFPVLPGPYNVTDAGFTLGINDVGNSAGVTAGQYGSFTMTADWVKIGGDPWSTEAEILFTTAAGSVEIDPPTSGGTTNGDPTTLTFSGGLAGIYDPSVDGFIEVFMDQSFAGSDTNWSNISITLEDFVPPPPPTVEGTLNASGFSSFDTFTDAAYGPGEVLWLELAYDGIYDLTIDTEGSAILGTSNDTEIGLYDSNGFLIGSDDDGGTGLLSSETFAGLDAGTYYIAAAEFNTTFGTGFNVTTTGADGGVLVVNALTAIPEPATCSLLLLGAVGFVARRRRS